MTGNLILDGVCRFCITASECRMLGVDYEWLGQKEVYFDMFTKTFEVELPLLTGSQQKHLICEPCITRLRKARQFRKQCEGKLINPDRKLKKEKQPVKVKVEASHSSLEYKPLVRRSRRAINRVREKDIITKKSVSKTESTAQAKIINTNVKTTNISRNRHIKEFNKTKSKEKGIDRKIYQSKLAQGKKEIQLRLSSRRHQRE